VHDAQGAEGVLGKPHRRLDLGLHRDVGLQADSVPALGRYRLHHRPDAAFDLVGDDDLRAFLRGQQGDLTAQSRAGPGDQHDFVL
jgi:hypothetical protein